MIATERHHKNKRPFCPYCGSFNINEIGKEGTGEHRHVCLAYDCVEISKKIREKERKILNTPTRQL